MFHQGKNGKGFLLLFCVCVWFLLLLTPLVVAFFLSKWMSRWLVFPAPIPSSDEDPLTKGWPRSIWSVVISAA